MTYRQLSKQCISFCMLSLCAFTMNASDVVKYVRISTEDSTPVFIRLDNHPTVKFENSEITVEANQNEKLTFPLQCNSTFTFQHEASVGDNFANRLMVSYQNHILAIHGLECNEKITIYDVQGHTQSTGNADSDGNWNISTSDWQSGIYILKSEKITSKIIIQ